MRAAVAFALVVLLAAALTGSVVGVDNYTPGDNGHPTNGPYTDLKGRAGDVTLTFQQNATIACTANTPNSFHMLLDYSITGAALPAGSTLIVYLSPNQGAINGNSGGNDAAYIAAVESNYIAIDMAGKSGTGTLDITINVTTTFQLQTGGVLGVIALDQNGTSADTLFNSKTNSLNCTEETPTPTPSPSPTPTAADSPTPSPSPTPTAADTPTPSPSPTPTAADTPTPSPSPTPTAFETPSPSPTPTAADSPTPSPTPTLPDTTMPAVDSTPPADPVGNLFVLLLVGSIAGLMFLGLPRKRAERPPV